MIQYTVEKGLKDIAELSNIYGQNPLYVFGGGGNTSYKTSDTLFIKPSGITLADIQPHQFIQMDRAKIEAFFSMEVPSHPQAREAMVKEAMLAAVKPETPGRPSVEAPLHHLLPFSLIVHLHPVHVNAMTCSKQGEEICHRLFPEAMWVEFVDPGFKLAKTLHARIQSWKQQHGSVPHLIFLANHGVFVGADTPEEIKNFYNMIEARLMTVLPQKDWQSLLSRGQGDISTILEVAPRLRTYLQENGNRATVYSDQWFEPVHGPLTPDHIVYAKSYPLVVDTVQQLPEELHRFQTQYGYYPAIVGIRNQAIFGIGPNFTRAKLAIEAARNAAAIATLAQTWGGIQLMTEEQRLFIENWEVESYRKQLFSQGSNKRLLNKVTLITGGAQGFGYGIAEELVRDGAQLILVDINAPGVQASAQQLASKGNTNSIVVAYAADVTDETSLRHLTYQVARDFGGIDILICNAGVLRAAPTFEMDVRDFDFVTNVNYKGYFLCVKTLGQLMRNQYIDEHSPWSDIIQINSKSGIQGSSRNAAYAGSKFGGIGLTQSFALELIDYRIKVNSICPGNYFEGPLWSDPEKGLFVQYLRAGKVPGAKTIEDVRVFYESKIPMKRGCYPADVACAIRYLVEQVYETGQALPVSGGQVMLH